MRRSGHGRTPSGDGVIRMGLPPGWVCAQIHKCMHTCTNTQMYAEIHKCTHKHTCACIATHTNTKIQQYTAVWMRLPPSLYEGTNLDMCANTHCITYRGTVRTYLFLTHINAKLIPFVPTQIPYKGQTFPAQTPLCVYPHLEGKVMGQGWLGWA